MGTWIKTGLIIIQSSLQQIIMTYIYNIFICYYTIIYHVFINKTLTFYDLYVIC